MQLNFSNEGYDGTRFFGFHVRRDHVGPGWFIFGRNAEKYGRHPDGSGAYVKLCGYREERAHRHYSGKVRHGWRTKREAEAVLAAHLASYPHLDRPE